MFFYQTKACGGSQCVSSSLGAENMREHSNSQLICKTRLSVIYCWKISAVVGFNFCALGAAWRVVANYGSRGERDSVGLMTGQRPRRCLVIKPTVARLSPRHPCDCNDPGKFHPEKNASLCLRGVCCVETG